MAARDGKIFFMVRQVGLTKDSWLKANKKRMNFLLVDGRVEVPDVETTVINGEGL